MDGTCSHAQPLTCLLSVHVLTHTRTHTHTYAHILCPQVALRSASNLYKVTGVGYEPTGKFMVE